MARSVRRVPWRAEFEAVAAGKACRLPLPEPEFGPEVQEVFALRLRESDRMAERLAAEAALEAALEAASAPGAAGTVSK
jgi:hypothetical protein